jgi:hypothetical protein
MQVQKARISAGHPDGESPSVVIDAASLSGITYPGHSVWCAYRLLQT